MRIHTDTVTTSYDSHVLIILFFMNKGMLILKLIISTNKKLTCD